MSNIAYPSFEVLRQNLIPSLKVELQEFRHRVTGARHLHLAADDEQNVFLAAFLTVPQDSTGVAHILEHTSLCGSQSYPVRDPFFMMSRRSLNTFMNAFTASDWTAYPFASQNKKDFNNLLDVYLDAVFFPLLHELDFAQEGHRVEFAQADDPESELVFKGVVFNEMKGVLSSPVSRLHEALHQHLFPTTTYHYNSGGDPADIPELSYQQLKAFHAQHYHPSNALFMTYGDITAAAHQQRFEAKALKRFHSAGPHFSIADEKRYTAAQSATAAYPLDEADTRDKTHIVVAWLWDPITDPRAVLETQVLSDVLLDNASSVLRHALETSDLGSAPSPLCGIDDNGREAVFTCGLEGSNPEHAEAVENLILGVIRQLAEAGVELSVLESVLHQLELSQREITGDGYPYGLSLILQALAPVIHGGDALPALDQDALLAELRTEIRDPNFIKHLARRLLLDNPHRMRLSMVPDPELASREAQAEKDRLAEMQKKLDQDARKRIIELTQALQERQQNEDDPELLPKVGLADVPADLKIPAGSQRALAGVPAHWYARGTNGMVYQQLVVDLPQFDTELSQLLPFYTLCLSEVGIDGQDYLAVQTRQAAITGGLSSYCLVRGQLDDIQQVKGIQVLAAKALLRNQAAMAELMVETFRDARFDEPARIRELIAQTRAQREAMITRAGHSLAMTAACAAFSPSEALSHRWSGLAGLQWLRQLDDSLDDPTALAVFCSRLSEIHEQMQQAPRRLLIVSEAEAQDAIAIEQATLWQGLAATAKPSSFALTPRHGKAQQGWSTATQVNFCALAYPTVAPSHADAPALYILGEFLRNGYLHTAIREQGGAYGASAGYHADSGAFRLFSYRDPRLSETFEDFQRALDWLQQSNHPARALEEAILGVIAAIDKPGSPAGEAIGAYYAELFGRTPEFRRALRRQVLEVTLDDLRRVAAHYLQPENASRSAIASAETLAALADWEIQSISDGPNQA